MLTTIDPMGILPTNLSLLQDCPTATKIHVNDIISRGGQVGSMSNSLRVIKLYGDTFVFWLREGRLYPVASSIANGSIRFVAKMDMTGEVVVLFEIKQQNMLAEAIETWAATLLGITGTDFNQGVGDAEPSDDDTPPPAG